LMFPISSGYAGFMATKKSSPSEGDSQSLTAPMEVVHLRDQRINKYIKLIFKSDTIFAEAGTGFAAGSVIPSMEPETSPLDSKSPLKTRFLPELRYSRLQFWEQKTFCLYRSFLQQDLFAHPLLPEYIHRGLPAHRRSAFQ